MFFLTIYFCIVEILRGKGLKFDFGEGLTWSNLILQIVQILFKTIISEYIWLARKCSSSINIYYITLSTTSARGKCWGQNRSAGNIAAAARLLWSGGTLENRWGMGNFSSFALACGNLNIWYTSWINYNKIICIYKVATSPPKETAASLPMLPG